MTTNQVVLLKSAIRKATGSNFLPIIDSNVCVDTAMRQAASQMTASVDCMTMQRLGTHLSEGMAVIMWGGYLGEELRPIKIQYGQTDFFDELSYLEDYQLIYEMCFDLLDRHEGEIPSGIIVDTLVAPYLALVIPQSNS